MYLLNKVTRGYRGRQGLTGGYSGLQGVTGATGCHSGLRGVTGDYKVLQKSFSLTRRSPDTFSWLILHNKVTRGLQGVTQGDRGLQNVTGGYTGYKGLQEVTRG